MTSSRQCDTCNKPSVSMYCIGCEKYFCNKDFPRHREVLFGEMDKIVESRNQLQETINKSMQPDDQHSPIIAEIDKWEKTTIKKVKDVAAQARQQTIHLLNTNQIQVRTEFKNFSQELAILRESGDFVEHDLARLNKMIKQFTLEIKQSMQSANIILHTEQNDQVVWESLIYVEEVKQREIKDRTHFYRPQLKSNLGWKQDAETIAGVNGRGNKLNQLDWPFGIHVDCQQQAIYIADHLNHRIVKWKLGENNGQIVAGGNGKGNRIDQLDRPTDVIVDQKNKSLIICDRGNRRVVRWSLEKQEDKQIIIENIQYVGLMMNENGDLFVSDQEKHEVKRWRKGEKEGTIVAGENGQGNKLDQLNVPTFIFIDRQDTVYVSDFDNHRVTKWRKGEKEGTIVAGGNGQGNSLKQLSHPNGLIVNEVGDVYVVDSWNHRIMCWPSGSPEGRIVVGGNGEGKGSNQLYRPRGLSFDAENNLYIADGRNNRIQRFDVDKN